MAKVVANGTILEIDFAGGTTYVPFTCIQELTPFGREREEVDGNKLAEGFDVPLFGKEGQSELTFTHFWDIGDSDGEALDTAFDSKTDLGLRLVPPSPATKDIETKGVIIGLGPQTLSSDTAYMREVTIRRTADLTYTAKTP